MASIRKRERQSTAGGRPAYSYAVQYRDKEGRQRTETFSRLRDAERRKSEVEVELASGRYIPPHAGRVTFGEWYGKWEAARTVSRARQSVDESRRDKHVLPRWARVPLDGIGFLEAQAWVKELETQMSPASVHECFRLLKLPLDAAVQDRRLLANPVLGVKLPRVSAKRKSPESVLTGVELQRLTQEVPLEWRAYVFATGWLGWRWSEGLGLRVRDVNFLRGRITVGEVVVREDKGRTYEKAGGKTDAAVRTIPLPASVAQVLSQHIRDHVPNPTPNTFLFRSRGRGSEVVPLRSNFARRILQPAAERAGLGDRGLTFHRLRDTAASLGLDAGLAVQDVQERLGHAKPSTTYDVYAHLIEGRQEAGTQALDRAIQQAQAGS